MGAPRTLSDTGQRRLRLVGVTFGVIGRLLQPDQWTWPTAWVPHSFLADKTLERNGTLCGMGSFAWVQWLSIALKSADPSFSRYLPLLVLAAGGRLGDPISISTNLTSH